MKVDDEVVVSTARMVERDRNEEDEDRKEKKRKGKKGEMRREKG